MILIRGECGSGKSAALRALEDSPPAGFRAVYVPVPTLDFSGIARWCLDRLGSESQQEPALALREFTQRERLALLLDDAELLPLEAALALRQLEREAAGNLLVVAACTSDAPANEPIVALGPPARAIEIAAGNSEQAAASVRDALAPAAKRAALVPARRAVQAPRAQTLPEPPAPSQRTKPAQPIASPPVDDPAPRAIPPTGPQIAPAGRTVSLALALAMACAAFLVPVAFGAGYWIGGNQRAVTAVDASAPIAAPAVSTAPPDLVAEAREQVEARELPSVATPSEIAPPNAVAPAPAPEPARRVAASRTLIEAPPPAAVRAAPLEPPARRAPAAPSRAGAREPAPVAEAREAAEWDVPVLISVEPGSDAP